MPITPNPAPSRVVTASFFFFVKSSRPKPVPPNCRGRRRTLANFSTAYAGEAVGEHAKDRGRGGALFPKLIFHLANTLKRGTRGNQSAATAGRPVSVPMDTRIYLYPLREFCYTGLLAAPVRFVYRFKFFLKYFTAAVERLA